MIFKIECPPLTKEIIEKNIFAAKNSAKTVGLYLKNEI